MNNIRTVYHFTNKGVMLTAAGFIAAVAGLGVYASGDQQTLDANTVPGISSLLNKEIAETEQPEAVVTSIIPVPEVVETESKEEVTETEEVKEESPQVAVKEVQAPSVPEDTTVQQEHATSKTEGDKYPIDNNYLNGVNSGSMAVQYKDYVVLAPAGSEIGEKKAKKLKAMAEKDKYKGVNTYRAGYLYTHQIDAEQTRLLCFKSLSYSETRSFGDYLFTPKSYFDFVGDICGKEDIEKPETGQYR